MPKLLDMSQWNIENSIYDKKDCYYKNKDAVEKVIRYISRTRWNETRSSELICVGGAGINTQAPINEIIACFLKVQSFYEINNRDGRRLAHFVFSFSDEDMILLNNDYALVDLLAKYISAYFFNKGFQVCYAVHYSEEKRVHIHFCINYINYTNGKKMHLEGDDFMNLEAEFITYFSMICSIAEQQRNSKGN